MMSDDRKLTASPSVAAAMNSAQLLAKIRCACFCTMPPPSTTALLAMSMSAEGKAMYLSVCHVLKLLPCSRNCMMTRRTASITKLAARKSTPRNVSASSPYADIAHPTAVSSTARTVSLVGTSSAAMYSANIVNSGSRLRAISMNATVSSRYSWLDVHMAMPWAAATGAKCVSWNLRSTPSAGGTMCSRSHTMYAVVPDVS
mmetsp:Transcript_28892/g.73759  ORF Transcript_28892/g.73759 Transcript_28892/m.73759 type:complete len:201 (+) Transcript_28892:667-1269(+)